MFIDTKTQHKQYEMRPHLVLGIRRCILSMMHISALQLYKNKNSLCEATELSSLFLYCVVKEMVRLE